MGNLYMSRMISCWYATIVLHVAHLLCAVSARLLHDAICSHHINVLVARLLVSHPALNETITDSLVTHACKLSGIS